VKDTGIQQRVIGGEGDSVR